MSSQFEILSCETVNGLPFGCSEVFVSHQLGAPDKAEYNYTGELEMRYGDCIYRCLNNRLVECTIPDVGRITIDGIAVLSVFEWLGGLADAVDMAKFRISLNKGIAYDARNPNHGSITLFERGRWDAVVLGR